MTHLLKKQSDFSKNKPIYYQNRKGQLCLKFIGSALIKLENGGGFIRVNYSEITQ